MKTVEPWGMKPREEAEGDAEKRFARGSETGRNAGGQAKGAASASSPQGNTTGQGTGLIEQMIDSENLNLAWKKVRANKGAAGVDGLGIEATMKLLRENRQRIEAELLAGTYVPKPVRRVEIPKANGGTRKLGVPTIMDRWIQQAVLQVIGPLFEACFSGHSYGFRPGRSAHQAVLAAREYQCQGKRWVVDIDLASFFDEVDHDLLIARVRRKVKDERVIKLIRAFLNAGVMLGGLVQSTDKGTPQGGPLSPLLSNILLDDLDKELEARGHAFCRYADDCNLYVASKRSGERVMASVSRFLERKMKLKVNRDKSAVDRPVNRTFLGYSFTSHQKVKIRVPKKTCMKMREKLKELFSMGTGRNLESFIQNDLNPLLRGWMGYFRLSETMAFAGVLDQWVRRRLRQIIWKQWKQPATRFARLMKAGVEEIWAHRSAGNGRGSWYNSGASPMNHAYPSKAFAELGLISLLDTLKSAQARPSV
jgi:RNA-directed DNA polymerase